MPKYLSEEWHKEFQRLWNDLLPDRPGTSARTQNKITGGPDGDRSPTRPNTTSARTAPPAHEPCLRRGRTRSLVLAPR